MFIHVTTLVGVDKKQSPMLHLQDTLILGIPEFCAKVANCTLQYNKTVGNLDITARYIIDSIFITALNCKIVSPGKMSANVSSVF